MAPEQDARLARLLTEINAARLIGIHWRVTIRIPSVPMLDIVVMAIASAFFALSIAYVYACDRL